MVSHGRAYLNKFLPSHQQVPTTMSSRVGTDGSKVMQVVEDPHGSCLWFMVPHLYQRDCEPLQEQVWDLVEIVSSQSPHPASP